MDKKQIEQWAREAAYFDGGVNSWIVPSADMLERFAALVAAHEREQCAVVCEAGMDHSMEQRLSSKAHQLNGADGELEALKFWSTVSLYNNARKLCAEAIRARGEVTPSR